MSINDQSGQATMDDESSFNSLFSQAYNSQAALGGGQDDAQPSPAPQQVSPELPSSAPQQPVSVQQPEPQTQVVASHQDGQPVGNLQPDSAAQPPQIPAVPAYITQARQLGIEVPDNAAPDVVAQATVARLQQLAPYAEYGAHLMPHAQRIQALLAAQQAPQQIQAPEPPKAFDPKEHFSKAWGVQWKPEFDRLVQSGMVERDPTTGAFKPVDGYEAIATPFLADMNSAAIALRQKSQEYLYQNPYAQTFDVLKTPIEQMIQQEVDRRLASVSQQSNEEAFVNKYQQDNATWLFQTNPFTKQPEWSQQGARFNAIYSDLINNKNYDVQDAIALAELRAGVQRNSPVAPVSSAVAPPAAQVPSQQPAAPTIPQTPQQSFLQNALQKAQHSPQAGGFAVQSPQNQPEKVSELELNSMFANAYAAANGLTR